MEINPVVKERQNQRPDVSAEERASIALLKGIRKLRWIGTEVEAERLQIMLTDFTQRTGCWLDDGSLDCAIGTGPSLNYIRRIDCKQTSLWTTISDRQQRLEMTRDWSLGVEGNNDHMSEIASRDLKSN